MTQSIIIRITFAKTALVIRREEPKMDSNSPTTYKEVSNYYDAEWASLEKQKLTGINSRHRFIMKFLMENGLKANHNVLEIGCGIGTLSSYLATKLKKGKLTGVDISPETIQQNKVRYKNFNNIEFLVSDMTDFSIDKKFDVIIFPDVLEHIPIEAHDNIFKTISTLIKPEGFVFINIPSPHGLEYLHIHHKELLQIIDQPIHTNILLDNVYRHGFYIETLKTYSVFYVEPDYQMMVLKVNKPYPNMTVKPKSKVLLNSIKMRINEFFNY
ncbi:MAG TPA: class I SAM-dependent methyltransferase [Bacteroidia bacterium]|nr:class I SAM-dependent methyltransferase [Bacteroidia bacterium]HQK96711.1 class I SAM-dependent methyltransferase [Bacteroidia bacterium]